MKVCSLLAAVAIVGLLAIAATTVARAQDAAPVKVAAVDPAAVEAVNSCYSACGAIADRFAFEILDDPPASSGFCRFWRHGIGAAARCFQGCEDVRAAYGSPASSVRDFMKAALAAESAHYEATGCHEKSPREAVRLIHR